MSTEFNAEGFTQARDLLTEMNYETPAGFDVETVVTVWLAGGGPTTYLELTYPDLMTWEGREAPDRAVFVHSYGSDHFRYQYPSDELQALVDRLWAEPEED